MYNLLRNKFLPIIIIFTLFIFNFCGNVFATELTFSNDKKINLPDIPEYPNENYNAYIIVQFNKAVYPYYLIFYDKDNIIFNAVENNFYSKSINLYTYHYYVSRYSDGSVIPEWSSFVTDKRYFNFSSGTYIENYYTTDNIKDTYGNVVFQATPRVVGEMTIPKIQQVEEIPQMMGKVLEMIIPIGLIIFGIGLIILLMRLVILRMR